MYPLDTPLDIGKYEQETPFLEKWKRILISTVTAHRIAGRAEEMLSWLDFQKWLLIPQWYRAPRRLTVMIRANKLDTLSSFMT